MAPTGQAAGDPAPAPRLTWAEIAELCEDAYRVIAPASLVAALDQRTGCLPPKGT